MYSFSYIFDDLRNCTSEIPWEILNRDHAMVWSWGTYPAIVFASLTSSAFLFQTWVCQQSTHDI